MKPIIQKLWMLVAMLYASISASAYDFEVANLQYDIVDLPSLTAKVVGCNEQLEGALIIPPTVNLSNRKLTVVGIASNAFIGNARITSLQIGDNVTDIGVSAFKDSKNITEISFGSSLKTIGNSAFQGCSSIKSISLKKPLESIGSSAFYSCSSLSSVDIPNSVKKIGSSAFHNCSALSKVNISDLNCWCLIDFNSSAFTSNFTLYIQNSPITIINIPNGISEIKSYAFDGFSNITGVTFPETVKKIGKNAFRGCGITSLALPENLDSIMQGAFCKTSIEELIIPKSVKFIDELDGLPRLKKISFEDGDNPIEIKFGSYIYGKNWMSDFVYGSDIEELYIGRPITMNCTMGHWINGTFIMDSYSNCLSRSAFCGLKSLTKVVIVEYCNQITPQWFWGCSNLKQLVIQDGSNPIEFFQNIYYDKKNENSYPQYSTQFKYVETFADCPLEYVYIGRNINFTQKYYGVSYPNKRLSPFENKETLNTVVIGNEVTNLPASNFFKDDNILSIEIGHSLSDIPDGCFVGNNEISSIAIRAKVPPKYSTSFPNSIYISTTLYVPIDALSAYQSAEPWKNFWNFSDIENIESGIHLIYNNETDNNISLGNDGLIYIGESRTHISIYRIDGKLQYSGYMEPNQYVSLDNGLYIVKLNNNPVKIKI